MPLISAKICSSRKFIMLSLFEEDPDFNPVLSFSEGILQYFCSLSVFVIPSFSFQPRFHYKNILEKSCIAGKPGVARHQNTMLCCRKQHERPDPEKGRNMPCPDPATVLFNGNNLNLFHCFHAPVSGKVIRKDSDEFAILPERFLFHAVGEDDVFPLWIKNEFPE